MKYWVPPLHVGDSIFRRIRGGNSTHVLINYQDKSVIGTGRCRSSDAVPGTWCTRPLGERTLPPPGDDTPARGAGEKNPPTSHAKFRPGTMGDGRTALNIHACTYLVGADRQRPADAGQLSPRVLVLRRCRCRRGSPGLGPWSRLQPSGRVHVVVPTVVRFLIGQSSCKGSHHHR